MTSDYKQKNMHSVINTNKSKIILMSPNKNLTFDKVLKRYFYLFTD